MKQKFHNILIQRCLDGECSESEKKDLEAWLAQSPDNQKDYQEVVSINAHIQDINLNFDPQTENGWQNLEGRLNLNSAKVVRINPVYRILRIAAIFVGLFVAGFLLRNAFNDVPQEMAQEIFVKKGESKKINLADGTVVHLNADSKLTIQPQFGLTNRNLSLEGEAFFEVAKNKNLPFIIETGMVSTKVVGTAFNLKAYPETEEIEINVTEGIVEFKDEDEMITLTVNKAAKFDKKEGKIKETSFDEGDLLWQEGGLAFNQVSFEEILTSLERKFDIEITNESAVGNEILTDEINATESIESILNRLKMTTNFNFKKSGNQYLITD